jgi:hypothetical protein
MSTELSTAIAGAVCLLLGETRWSRSCCGIGYGETQQCFLQAVAVLWQVYHGHMYCGIFEGWLLRLQYPRTERVQVELATRE